ncbi:MAG: hypothetical protein ABI206_04685 [Antricoccus sp.]
MRMKVGDLAIYGRPASGFRWTNSRIFPITIANRLSVIRANAEALLSGESTQQYEFGLDILLAAFASHPRHDKSAEPN